jgi:hypothetical protein
LMAEPHAKRGGRLFSLLRKGKERARPRPLTAVDPPADPQMSELLGLQHLRGLVFVRLPHFFTALTYLCASFSS